MYASSKSLHDGLLIGSGACALLVSSNENRDSVILHNADNVLYVKCGNTASNSDFTYRLTRNMTLEISGYIGPITAICNTGTTYVQITELV